MTWPDPKLMTRTPSSGCNFPNTRPVNDDDHGDSETVTRWFPELSGTWRLLQQPEISGEAEWQRMDTKLLLKRCLSVSAIIWTIGAAFWSFSPDIKGPGQWPPFCLGGKQLIIFWDSSWRRCISKRGGASDCIVALYRRCIFPSLAAPFVSPRWLFTCPHLSWPSGNQQEKNVWNCSESSESKQTAPPTLRPKSK